MTRSSGIGRDSCKVLDNFLGTFRLSCTRFTAAGMMSIDYLLCKRKRERYKRDENTLVFPLLPHIHPSAFCNREYMRRVLVPPLSTILMNNSIRV